MKKFLLFFINLYYSGETTEETTNQFTEEESQEDDQKNINKKIATIIIFIGCICIINFAAFIIFIMTSDSSDLENFILLMDIFNNQKLFDIENIKEEDKKKIFISTYQDTIKTYIEKKFLKKFINKLIQSLSNINTNNYKPIFNQKEINKIKKIISCYNRNFLYKYFIDYLSAENLVNNQLVPKLKDDMLKTILENIIQ